MKTSVSPKPKTTPGVFTPMGKVAIILVRAWNEVRAALASLKTMALQLPEAVRLYRMIAIELDDLETQKKLLRDRIITEMSRAKINVYRIDDLRALHSVRLTREYRVTPELATLLQKAKVKAYISSGPVDEAVKAGRMDPRAAMPFVRATEIPYLEVREVKS